MVDSGNSKRDFELVRSVDQLSVRSTCRTNWAAGIFVAIGIWAFWALAHGHVDPANPIGPFERIVIPAAFVVVGAYFMLARTVKTVFDLQSRQVRQTVLRFNGWYTRARVYSFADIASVGVNMADGTIVPKIHLKSGANIRLNATGRWDIDREAYASAIDAISAATGLPRQDILE
jgi:hypothetical protein